MAFDQLDVVRVRTTLEAASSADDSWLTTALVYQRARDAVAVLVAGSKLEPEFDALFPKAEISLGAVPGYPALLCRQLQAWLGEVDAAREALSLSPELALVDGELRGDPFGAQDDAPSSPAFPPANYRVRWSSRSRRS